MDYFQDFYKRLFYGDIVGHRDFQKNILYTSEPVQQPDIQQPVYLAVTNVTVLKTFKTMPSEISCITSSLCFGNDDTFRRSQNIVICTWCSTCNTNALQSISQYAHRNPACHHPDISDLEHTVNVFLQNISTLQTDPAVCVLHFHKNFYCERGGELKYREMLPYTPQSTN